jgi:type VI secretion system secreted protein Hcp
MAHEDFFLKVDAEQGGAVKGEAQDSDHKDEIDVIDWSWGMSAPAAPTGLRKARAAIHHLVIRKRMDSASTALMKALSHNEKLTTVVLTARGPAGPATADPPQDHLAQRLCDLVRVEAKQRGEQAASRS